MARCRKSAASRHSSRALRFNSGQQVFHGERRHTLLLDADMDENITRKYWDGPPPAIWTF